MQGHPWRNINIALRFQKQISQKIANKYTANLALGEKDKNPISNGCAYIHRKRERVRQIQIPLGGDARCILFHVLQRQGFQRAYT